MYLKKKLALFLTSLGVTTGSLFTLLTPATAQAPYELTVCNRDPGTYLYYSVGWIDNNGQRSSSSWIKLSAGWGCNDSVRITGYETDWALRAFSCPIPRNAGQSPSISDCTYVVRGNFPLCTLGENQANIAMYANTVTMQNAPNTNRCSRNGRAVNEQRLGHRVYRNQGPRTRITVSNGYVSSVSAY